MIEQEKLNKLIALRREIAHKYSIDHGWGGKIEELTIDQVLEIRELPEWKDAPNKVEEMDDGEIQPNT